MSRVPLNEILNHTTDKYRTTVAAQKVFHKIADNIAALPPEDRKEKAAVTCLRYIFLGKARIVPAAESEKKPSA